MSQTKTQIPHYIQGTHSSQVKSLKQTENPSKLTRPQPTKYGLNVRKRSTENEDQKDNKKTEQSEINRLKSLVEKQKEKISSLESLSGKENILRDEITEWENKCKKMDEKVEYYEKQLLLCHIDPVTLQSLNPTEETQDVLREIERKKKLDVSKLKISIDDMNNKTLNVLSELKIIGDELDKICPEEDSAST